MNSPHTSPAPRKGKYLAVKVVMLDDSVHTFHVPHKAMGIDLFTAVTKKLQLLEVDYFDLEHIDHHGTHYWLDKEKPVLKQMAQSRDLTLHFLVKFYTPDPGLLEDEFTRYLFALQIKRDLAEGMILCQENTAALLASYIVQAQLGDFSEEDYHDYSYLQGNKFLSNQTDELLERIMEHHRQHVGQTPMEADFNLLDTARKCELYGIRMHQAKDHEDVCLNLAVAHMGVLVYQGFTKINTFSWAKIRKLSFKRKKFLIKLHPEGYGYYKDTVEFYFDTRNECKNFWKKCIEHHSFFRCQSVKKLPRNKTRVVSRGSSFRYSGRTQKQLVEHVRENYVKRPPFERTQSLRTVHSRTPGATPKTGTLNSRSSRERDFIGLHNTSASSGSRTLDTTSQENILSAAATRMETEVHDDSSQSGSRSISSPKKDQRGGQSVINHDFDGDEEIHDHVEMAHKGAPDHFNYSYYKISYDSSSAVQNANDNDDKTKIDKKNKVKVNVNIKSDADQNQSQPIKNVSADPSLSTESPEFDKDKSGSSEILPRYPDVPDTDLFIDEDKLNQEIKQAKEKERETEAQRQERLEHLAQEIGNQRKRKLSSEIPPVTEIIDKDQASQLESKRNILSELNGRDVRKLQKQGRVESSDDNTTVVGAVVNFTETKIENVEKSDVHVDTKNERIKDGLVNGQDIPYVLRRRVVEEQHSERESRKGLNIAIHSNIPPSSGQRSPRLTKEQRKMHLEKIKTDLTSPIEPPAKSPKSPRDKSPRRPMELVTYSRLPPMNSYSSLDDTVSPSSVEKEIISHFRVRSKSTDSEKSRDSTLERDNSDKVHFEKPERSRVEENRGVHFEDEGDSGNRQPTIEEYNAFAEQFVASIIESACTGDFSQYVSEGKQNSVAITSVNVEDDLTHTVLPYTKDVERLKLIPGDKKLHSDTESDDIDRLSYQTDEDVNKVLSEYAPGEVSSDASISSSSETEDQPPGMETAAEVQAETILESIATCHYTDEDLDAKLLEKAKDHDYDQVNENADKSLDELEVLEHLPPDDLSDRSGDLENDDIFVSSAHSLGTKPKIPKKPPVQLTLSADEEMGATALSPDPARNHNLLLPDQEGAVGRPTSAHSSISSEGNVEHPDGEDVLIFEDQLVPPGTARLLSSDTNIHYGGHSVSSEDSYEAPPEELDLEVSGYSMYAPPGSHPCFAPQPKLTPHSSISSEGSTEYPPDAFFTLDQTLPPPGTMALAHPQPKLTPHSSISSDGSPLHDELEIHHNEFSLLPPGTLALAKPVPKLTPHSSISSDGSVEHPQKDDCYLSEDFTLPPPGTLALAKPQPKLTPHSSISSDGSIESPCRDDIHVTEELLQPPPGTIRLADPVPKLTPHSSISSDGSVDHAEMEDVQLMEEQLLPPPGTAPLAQPQPNLAADSSGSSSPSDNEHHVMMHINHGNPRNHVTLQGNPHNFQDREENPILLSNLAALSASPGALESFPSAKEDALMADLDYQSSTSSEELVQDEDEEPDDDLDFPAPPQDYANPFFYGGYGNPDYAGHEEARGVAPLNNQYYLDRQSLDAHFAPLEGGLMGNGHVDMQDPDASDTDSTMSDSFELLDQGSSEDLLENLEHMEAEHSGHSADSSDDEATRCVVGEPDVDGAEQEEGPNNTADSVHRQHTFDSRSGTFFSNPYAQREDDSQKRGGS